MEEDLRVTQVDLQDLRARIRAIIAVRTSAYEQWNGQKTLVEQEQQADAWFRK